MLDDIGYHSANARPTGSILRGEAGNVSPSAVHADPAQLEEAPPPPVREPSLRWYVVRHAPFEGGPARNAIRRLGFEAHWPRLIKRRRGHDDWLEPMFPGYLFALFDAGRSGWGRINRLDQVVDIIGVRDRGRPIALPVGEVEALIGRAGAVDCAIDQTGDADESPFVPFVGGRLLSSLDAVRQPRKPWLRIDALKALVADQGGRL